MDKITQMMRKMPIGNYSNNIMSMTQRSGKASYAGTWIIPKPSFGQKAAERPFRRDTVSGWTKVSHRVGAIGKKIGMMTTYIGENAYPVTVIQIPSNQITQIKRKVNDGADMIQVGADEIRLKNVPKPLQGHFAKANIPPKRVLMEFRVTRNAMDLELGTPILSKHFVPGQLITVKGTNTGKGFAGGMKRWHFSGQPATHGVSLTHRSIGSTGCRQTPGRVFKGRKMPGRLGGKSCTVKNLQVLKINTEMNCILVKGAVPGKKGTYLKITDSRSMKWKEAPPFPTYIPTPNDMDNEEELVFKPATKETTVNSNVKPIAPKLISKEESKNLLNLQKETIAKKLLKNLQQ
ncbi:hypothetical protein RB653_008763 [Dictyostelium firmibasis]|uniref:Large ribosomal subunit protein uL3m n=1 Tax=Dictyostelium firmibasis TaxID=79012 RepID=A0AAN7TT27_9MYCE